MTERLARLRETLELLDELERGHIAYRLGRVRDALLIDVSVPGERWEIEMFSDGHIEVERFISTGDIGDRNALRMLWKHASDDKAVDKERD